MQNIQIPTTPVQCRNFISGKWEGNTPEQMDVTSPYSGEVIGQVLKSGSHEINHAVKEAKRAAEHWGQVPLKERSQIMFRFREILLRDIETLSHSVSSESGKLLSEAKAGLMKGIEVLEFALSIQNLDDGGKMQVSRGVHCEYRREPLGVVAGITPFNFPAMVPMWMIPIAITLGNAFVWKPSDKTPLTSLLIAKALKESGLPDGVLTIVQGGREAVEALCDHPTVQAIGFVGSTPIAKSVYQRATAAGKRALTLGGAKNHIILMPDADDDVAIGGITSSYTGCAGQRCMAASVLVAVGDTDRVIHGVVKKSKELELGEDMGAIITQESLSRLHQAIEKAQKNGAEILLDGRKAKAPKNYSGGYWLGPTILDNVKPGSEAAQTELFGPVLSIIRVNTLSEALAIENDSLFGNAASVFTTNGGTAEEVTARSRAGMVGINIGVPVPREPFSFGGLYESKFGYGDITGKGGIEFWSSLKKVTSKWALQKDQTWMG